MSFKVYFESKVLPEWIDEFGHLNYLEYQKAADVATMAIWAEVNDGRQEKERAGNEFVIVEVHVRYIRELRFGQQFKVESVICDHDDKRMLLLHEVKRDDTVCGQIGVLCLSFNLDDRQVRPFLDRVRAKIEARTDRDVLDGHPLRDCMKLRRG